MKTNVNGGLKPTLQPTLRRILLMLALLGAIMPLPELFDSGVPRSSSELLARWYVQFGKVIADKILHPPGNSANAQAFNQQRASQQIAQIKKLLAALNVKAADWIGKNFESVARDSRAIADRQARELGIHPAGAVTQGSFSLIDSRAVSVLARDAYGDLAKAGDAMAARGERVLRQTAQLGLSEAKLNEVLAGGIIEGTPVETTRKLRKELEAIHGGTVTIKNKNGEPMEFEVGYYADLVARTKTREATVTARHERLQELDLDLVSIVGRVSDNFCSAFLGAVFSLSGKSDKYPAYDSLPGGGAPFHPNCSKNTRPFVEELATPKQLDHAEVVEPAMLGMSAVAAQKAYKDLQVRQQIEDRYKAATKAA